MLEKLPSLEEASKYVTKYIELCNKHNYTKSIRKSITAFICPTLNKCRLTYEGVQKDIDKVQKKIGEFEREMKEEFEKENPDEQLKKKFDEFLEVRNM